MLFSGAKKPHQNQTQATFLLLLLLQNSPWKSILAAAQERRCPSFCLSFANQVLLLLADVYLILFSFILHNFAFPPEEIIVSILVKSLCMSAYPCLLGRFYYTLLALWDVNSGWFCIEIGYQACQVPKINKSKELCYFKKEGGERK